MIDRSGCERQQIFFEPLSGIYIMKDPSEMQDIINRTINGTPWYDFAYNAEKMLKQLGIELLNQELLNAYEENHNGFVVVSYQPVQRCGYFCLEITYT